METISISLDTVWVLLATTLVFLMQAGFALVETGLTRTKNTGNIIMKNFLDFAIGSVLFWIVGYSLMFGLDVAGLVGFPDFFSDNSYNKTIPDAAFLMFQTVFAATAATIVSGAVAERTNFEAYILFSAAITLFIYPISGHWIWGGGWLSQLETPFHDFAGSTAVHSVGAWASLVGVIMVGPRLGKYNGKANAIPGHNLGMAALGVFILWFGWFGFNAGSQLAASGEENAKMISHIFLTTNLGGAAGLLSALAVTWIKYKRPGISLSLNGALAGLVGVTAGCDVISPSGAVLIGTIVGIVMVFAVEFIDQKLRFDDPVGAISVHGVGGILGTLLVGIFATKGGLLYNGGFSLLISQLIGIVTVGIWVIASSFVVFKIIDKLVGLRVPKRVEEEGLDLYEHGETAYN